MHDMDRPTASLIVRMRMALIDEGLGTPDDEPEDAAVIQAAFARVQRPPMMLSDHLMEEYGWGALMGEAIDAPRCGVPATRANVSVMRLTDRGGGVQVVTVPVRLEVAPLVLGEDPDVLSGMDLVVSARVPIGSLGTDVDRLRPVAGAFAAAAERGRFMLEAWSGVTAAAEVPEGLYGLTTFEAVSASAEGLGLLDIAVPGVDADDHVVTLFRGRAEPVATLGSGDVVMDFRLSSEAPPAPAVTD